jgi:hypothetical protein
MSLSQRIESLQKKRQKLKLQQQVEETRPLPDFVRIGLIKRENLKLKDMIFSLATGEETTAGMSKRSSA